jgi:hypothetical protein
MRSTGVLTLLIAIALLAASATPSLAAGPRQSASVTFTQQAAGANTGLRIAIDYRNPNDSKAKPYAVQKIVTTLAKGARIDTTVPGQCKLSDAELMANGARDCPPASLVGTGVVTLSSTDANPSATADVTLVNNANELIFVVTPRGTPARMIIRSPIRGNSITNEIPRLPGGPPDGVTAIRTADLRIAPVSARVGSRLRNYITTPPSCPGQNLWSNFAVFNYFDGQISTLRYDVPCLDTTPPKVRLTGISRRSCVHRRIHARVRVTEAAHLRGVAIRLNGRKVKSTKRKRFPLRIRYSKLRSGRNRLSIVAVDKRGNRVKFKRSFLRCR